MTTWPWILLSLFGLFQGGLSIMCYECNSATNLQCSDQRLPDTLKKNCSDHDRGDMKHTLCRKIIQHVDSQVNGQWVSSRVIRSCGWDESKYKGACYHRSGFGSRHEVCSCTKDLCNSAVDSTPLSIASLMFISVGKIVL